MEFFRKLIQMKFLAVILGGLGVAHCTIQCGPGQVADSNSICIQPQYIQGCHKYATTTTCQECQYRFDLQADGSCKFSPQTFEPCCVSQDQNGNCQICNKGLYLNEEGTCQQVDLPGCLEKDLNGKCVNCVSGFLLENGACNSGIMNCQKYMEIESDQGRGDKVCQKCGNGYSLVNNACLKNKILGCITENDKKCTKCEEPFQLRDGRCEISSCVTYNDYGCTACDCGFFLNHQNKCQEMLAGCIRYQRGRCIDCQSHFKLEGGKCVIQGCEQMSGVSCISCKEEKYQLLDDGSCKLKNCLFWKDGICRSCEESYYPFEGQCLKVGNGEESNLRVEGFE